MKTQLILFCCPAVKSKHLILTSNILFWLDTDASGSAYCLHWVCTLFRPTREEQTTELCFARLNSKRTSNSVETEETLPTKMDIESFEKWNDRSRTSRRRASDFLKFGSLRQRRANLLTCMRIKMTCNVWDLSQKPMLQFLCSVVRFTL